MKKVISVVLLVAIVCSLFCACGSGNDELKAQVIGIWTVKKGTYDFYKVRFNEDGTFDGQPLPDGYLFYQGTWKIKSGKVVVESGNFTYTFSDFVGISMDCHNYKNDFCTYEKDN